jgi:hypothetical protein
MPTHLNFVVILFQIRFGPKWLTHQMNGCRVVGIIWWEKKEPPNWLATDALLAFFAEKRTKAIAQYTLLCRARRKQNNLR